MRTDLLAAIAAAAALAAGCAAPAAAPAARDRSPKFEIVREIVRDRAELEPRFLDDVARELACLAAPRTDDAPVAHAVGVALAERIAKKREWGARAPELAEDLELAAR